MLSSTPPTKAVLKKADLEKKTSCTVIKTSAYNPNTQQHGADCWIVYCSEEDGGTGEEPSQVLPRLVGLPLTYRIFHDAIFAFPCE